MEDKLRILVVEYQGMNAGAALAQVVEAIGTLWSEKEPLQIEADEPDEE